MSTEHTAYYEEMLNQGTKFQDFVSEQLAKVGIPFSLYSHRDNQYRKGESVQLTEVKYDRRFRGTGHLYIEIAEKTRPENPDFVPSGINRPCKTYVIGDYETLYIFPANILRIFNDTKRYRYPETNPTSRGYLLPIETAERWCWMRIECGDHGDPSPFLPVAPKASP